MEINKRNIRQWSRLGTRGVFGQAILAVAPEHSNLMVMSADLGSSSGLERFRKAFPKQFLNAGIAEQNMIGVASGLAKEGFNVFATSFSPFITMRACEQVRMNMGYMEMNIKTVAIGSGIGMGFLGNSHFGIEDVAVMRAIPNITIVNPADCSEVVKVVEAAVNFNGPMYIRLTGTANCPIVYSEDYTFEIGKAITLREGSDLTIITCGPMVHESLQASELLAELGINATVINMHTIKPLDQKILIDIMAKKQPVITIEEHSIIGGLGSAIAEYMAPLKERVRHLSIGLPDAFITTGEYRYMIEQQGLDAISLSKKIQQFLKS